MVTSKTMIFGLIGNPIAHSISPQIHNAAYNEMELDAIYICLQIRCSASDAVRSAAALGIRGLNVTIPFKSAVMTAVSRCDDLARLIGAVNVLSLGDEISGYNTDARAAVSTLKEGIGTELRGLSAVIVGAGGSARAVAFGLALEGCRVTICNRTGSRARELAAEVAVGVPESEARSVEFSRSCLEAVLHRSDILVNATPVGMYPENDRSIVSPTMLHRDLAVMDLVYNPPRTQLLRDAEKAGCKAIGGLGMLVYQAAESICIWTGLRAPTVTMMVEAERALMAYQSP